MLKALNLPASELTADAQDYMLKGGAQGLVLWAPEWAKVEPSRGRVDLTQFAVLDANVAWALKAGLRVLLAVPCAYPAWSYARRAGLLNKSGTTLPPDDTSPTGPWASYLALVLKRYPRALPIVLNEPDYAFKADPLAGEHVAWMVRSAATVAERVGCPHILAPACATAAFAKRVLHWLPGWKPPVDVGWAHHHYIDVDAGNTTELKVVLDALHAARWKPGRRVWLTEGGYIYRTVGTPNAEFPVDPGNWSYSSPVAAQEAKQLANVTSHFHACKFMPAAVGVVECWAQYEYQDSLWGGWASGLVGHGGGAHPLREKWLTL